jgi:hypothetical protein
VQVQSLLAVQHEDGERGAEDEVSEGHRDGEGSQQLVAPEPAHAVGDVGSERGTWRGCHGRDADSGHQGSRHGEGQRVEAERRGGRHYEQPRTQRLGGELVDDGERRAEPGVRGGQLIVGDYRGHESRRGRVGQSLADAQDEEDDVPEQDRDRAGRDRRGQAEQRRGADQVDDYDQSAAVEPIRPGAADQREEQPRQLLGERRTGDCGGVCGDRGDQ